MSSPRQRVVTSGIVGCCAVLVVVSLGLSAWTFVRQSQADTIRRADAKAQSTTKVSTCFQQVSNAPAVLGALRLIDTLADNSIKANRDALKTAKRGDPIRARAKASLGRIIPARAGLTKLIEQSEARVPKVADCYTLARDLNVDPKPFEPKKTPTKGKTQ